MADAPTGTENKSLAGGKREQLERYVRKPPILPLMSRMVHMAKTNPAGLGDMFRTPVGLDELAQYDPQMNTPAPAAKQTAMPEAKSLPTTRKKRNTILTGDEDAAIYRPSIGG
jgi:hypothetical protein